MCIFYPIFLLFSLQCDPVISERLMKSSDFSQVFNIVLQGQKTTISSHDMPGMHKEHGQRTVSSI